MVGERISLFPGPHHLAPTLISSLLLKCITPSIFFLSTPRPIVSSQLNYHSLLTVNDQLPELHSLSHLPSTKLSKTCLIPILRVSDSAAQNHHMMEVVIASLSCCYLVCTSYISKEINVGSDVLGMGNYLPTIMCPGPGHSMFMSLLF